MPATKYNTTRKCLDPLPFREPGKNLRFAYSWGATFDPKDHEKLADVIAEVRLWAGSEPDRPAVIIERNYSDHAIIGCTWAPWLENAGTAWIRWACRRFHAAQEIKWQRESRRKYKAEAEEAAMAPDEYAKLQERREQTRERVARHRAAPAPETANRRQTSGVR